MFRSTVQEPPTTPLLITDMTPTDNFVTDTDTLVPAVPTMAEWQLVVLGLVLALAGGWLAARRA